MRQRYRSLAGGHLNARGRSDGASRPNRRDIIAKLFDKKRLETKSAM